MHIDISKPGYLSDAPDDDILAQFGGSISAAIDLKNINNQQFVGELYLGTPPQKIPMQFDSGSAVLYVVTDKCENCPADMQRFDTSKSTSYKPTGERQKEAYGAGLVEGDVAQETVCYSKDKLSCIENT